MVLDVLLGSAVSQLCMIVCVVIVWRWFTKAPDLPGRLAYVREFVSRKKRVAKARIAKERAKAERSTLQKTLERGRQLVRDRIDVGDAQQLMTAGIGFAIVTVVLFQGDDVLMTLLNGGSGLLGLSLRAWAVGSPWIVVSIFVGIHMLIGMAIIDPDRPARTLRLARGGALTTGVLVLVAMWGSLSGRGVDFATAGWAADAIQWSLWLLVLVLAMSGGFTAVLATEHFRQARLAAQVAELETRDDEYERHIAALDAEIAAYDDKTDPTATPPASSSGAVGAMGQAAALFVAIGTAAMLAGFAGSARASERAVASATTAVAGAQANRATDKGAGILMSPPAWLVAAARPAQGECDVQLDVTASISPAERTDAAKDLAAMLKNIGEAYDCTTIRLSAFSADAPFQRLQEFVLPALSHNRSCAPEKAVAGGIAGLARVLYPSLKAEDRRTADAACQQRVRMELESISGPRNAALADAANAAEALSRVPAVGNTTPLYQTAARAMQRSQHVIEITDGAQTADWYKGADGAPLQIPVPDGSSLLFLLVPSVGEHEAGANRAAERASKLQSVFPGADVQLLNEATPRFWERLSSIKQDK